MKALLFSTCAVSLALTVAADEATDNLRQEFESYKAQSEARIQALEEQNQSINQTEVHQGDLY